MPVDRTERDDPKRQLLVDVPSIEAAGQYEDKQHARRDRSSFKILDLSLRVRKLGSGDIKACQAADATPHKEEEDKRVVLYMDAPGCQANSLC
jgi:hypothetical protein